MKTLKDRIASKTNIELIEAIDSPADYSQEAINLYKLELEHRRLPKDTIAELATDFNTTKTYQLLEQSDPFVESPSMHKSFFLSKAELKEIYKAQMELLLENNSGFRFDVWKYAIGGI